MNIFSKLKTAVLAGAISTVPLSDTVKENNTNNIKQFELPSEKSNKENDLNNYDLKDKFIETSEDEAFLVLKENPDLDYDHKGYKIQENKYYDTDDIETKTPEIAAEIEKDKFTMDSLNHFQDKIFKENSYLDMQAEAINSTVEKMGNETNFKLQSDDAAGVFDSTEKTISIETKKNAVYLHEKAHQINNQIIPREFNNLVPDHCAKYQSAVDEAFAHSFSAAVYCKENREMDLSDYSKKDHSVTIGKNLGLFLYDNDDKTANFYRDDQFAEARRSKSNLEYQALSTELGLSKVTGDQYIKYCVEKFSEFYGTDAKLIMKEVEKHKGKQKDNNFENLMVSKANEKGNSEMFEKNTKIIENNDYLKSGAKEPIYLSPTIKRNIKDLKEFISNDSELSNENSNQEEMKVVEKNSKNFGFLDIQYQDENKNEKLRQIKDSEKIKELQKLVTEISDDYDKDLKDNDKSCEKTTKSNNNRRDKLNHFKANGTQKAIDDNNSNNQKPFRNTIDGGR